MYVVIYSDNRGKQQNFICESQELEMFAHAKKENTNNSSFLPVCK